MPRHKRPSRVAFSSTATIVAVLAALLVGFMTAPARATGSSGNSDVCPGLDSGKIDVNDGIKSVTVTAPEGQLIDGYCVKAGSTDSGTGGPVSVDVDPPKESVTITYPSGKDISHYSVSYTDRVKPDKPADKVDYGDWTDGDKDCETRKVTQTRTKTVTTYTWSESKREWVANKPTTTTETRERDMTADEIKACAGDKPADKVVETEWKDGDKDCESKTVTQTRTVTTTPYVYDSSTGKWVLGTPVVKTETQTRDMTADEIKACDNTPPPVCYTDNPSVVTNGSFVTVTGAKPGLWLPLYDQNGDLIQNAQVGEDCQAMTPVPPSECEATTYKWYLVSVEPPTSITGDPSGVVKKGVITVPGDESLCVPTPPTKVTPTSPSHVDKCETINDTYTIPSKEGVVYKVNGVVTPAGTYPGTGTVNITSDPASDKYELVGTTSWSFTFTDVKCEPEPPADIKSVTVVEFCGGFKLTNPNGEDVRVLYSDDPEGMPEYKEVVVPAGKTVSVETSYTTVYWAGYGVETDGLAGQGSFAVRQDCEHIPPVEPPVVTPPVVNPPVVTPPTGTPPVVKPVTNPERPNVINTDGGTPDSNNSLALLGAGLAVIILLGSTGVLAVSRKRR